MADLTTWPRQIRQAPLPRVIAAPAPANPIPFPSSNSASGYSSSQAAGPSFSSQRPDLATNAASSAIVGPRTRIFFGDATATNRPPTPHTDAPELPEPRAELRVVDGSDDVVANQEIVEDPGQIGEPLTRYPTNPPEGFIQEIREALQLPRAVASSVRRSVRRVGGSLASRHEASFRSDRSGGTVSQRATTPQLARTGATTYRHRFGAAFTPKDPVAAPIDWWKLAVRFATCCVCDCCLAAVGKKNAAVRQAWREKVTLCLLIMICMAALGFLTFGLEETMCPRSSSTDFRDAILDQNDHRSVNYRDDVIISGKIYDFTALRDLLLEKAGINLTIDWFGADLTALFQPPVDLCASFRGITSARCSLPNRIPGSPPLAPSAGSPCPSSDILSSLSPKGQGFFTWTDVGVNVGPPHTLTVYNGLVLNITALGTDGSVILFTYSTRQLLLRSIGRDGTRLLSTTSEASNLAMCLSQLSVVGDIDQEPMGCVGVSVIQSFTLSVILSLLGAKLFSAMAFHWLYSRRLVIDRSARRVHGFYGLSTFTGNSHRYTPKSTPQFAVPLDVVMSASAHEDPEEIIAQSTVTIGDTGRREAAAADDPYVILFVTCYSEGEDGIRGTLESLASSNYPDARKLLWVVADGNITGSGNRTSTPDAIVGMMDPLDGQGPIEAKSYVSIGHGARQLNMAKVFVGHFHHTCGGSVPMIAVVKCGTPEEAAEPHQKKSGNRGKRDSQMILMNFMSRILFDHAMTPLDFEIAKKIHAVLGGGAVRPDAYELVLMVDADTRIAPESLQFMVQAMKNDAGIIGLCGETRIANKRTSWVTAIQVFEYFISHHLGKAFESSFGAVTCLPGCFCMYRVKVPKGPHGAWTVPVLANPDIVEEYGESSVDTLHKKNLLLLGEDRYLTTLMLRTFPKRKIVFVPQAVCRTVVPDTFKTLLSQRRRWINSTVHNLYELVQMRDLCGVFCFSVQFVVALELIGTIVLPAALLFLFVLLFMPIFTGTVSTLPIYLMIGTLGLPGLLIILTTRRYVYVLWLLIYIVSIPVWNFVLPLYAFWNFDDFSWGETRRVEGEGRGREGHGAGDDARNTVTVAMKRWSEWEAERIVARRMQLHSHYRQSRGSMSSSAATIYEPAPTPSPQTVERREPSAPTTSVEQGASHGNSWMTMSSVSGFLRSIAPSLSSFSVKTVTLPATAQPILPNSPATPAAEDGSEPIRFLVAVNGEASRKRLQEGARSANPQTSKRPEGFVNENNGIARTTESHREKIATAPAMGDAIINPEATSSAACGTRTGHLNGPRPPPFVKFSRPPLESAFPVETVGYGAGAAARAAEPETIPVELSVSSVDDLQYGDLRNHPVTAPKPAPMKAVNTRGQDKGKFAQAVEVSSSLSAACEGSAIGEGIKSLGASVDEEDEVVVSMTLVDRKAVKSSGESVVPSVATAGRGGGVPVVGGGRLHGPRPMPFAVRHSD